jgi:hypothetical protein
VTVLRIARLKTTPESDDHRDYEQRAKDQQDRIDSGAGPRPLEPGEK